MDYAKGFMMVGNKGVLKVDSANLVLGDFVSILIQYSSALTSLKERSDHNG